MKKSQYSLIIAVLFIMTSSARAELLYNLTFDDTLSSTGSVKGTAVEELNGANPGEYSKSISPLLKNGLSRTFSVSESKGVDIVLPGSGSKLQLDKTGKMITIACWIKISNLKSERGIVTKISGKEKAGWAFYVGSGTHKGELGWSAYSSKGYSVERWSNPNGEKVPLGVWTHVAFTFKVGEAPLVGTFYINGKSVGKFSLHSSQTVVKSTESIRVGSKYKGGYRPLNGLLDELKIFDTTLTEKEIQALTNSTKHQ